MKNTCICCGKFIPHGNKVCDICVALALNVPEHTYSKFNCPKCGEPLIVLQDILVNKCPASIDQFGYECRHLIRHCDICGSDWENEWCTENGDVGESELRRKFWG